MSSEKDNNSNNKDNKNEKKESVNKSTPKKPPVSRKRKITETNDDVTNDSNMNKSNKKQCKKQVISKVNMEYTQPDNKKEEQKNERKTVRKTEPKKTEDKKEEKGLPKQFVDPITLLFGFGMPNNMPQRSMINSEMPSRNEEENNEEEEEEYEEEPIVKISIKDRKSLLFELKEQIDKTTYEFKSFTHFLRFIEIIVTLWDKRFNTKEELFTMRRLLPVLKELDYFVGMAKTKSSVINLILKALQSDKQNFGYKHTLLLGPPGTGKTEFAKILSKIFIALRFLSKNSKVIEAKRDDLVGEYLGQSGAKTRAILNKAIGNVLFLDEAYWLGNRDGKKDIYAKEVVDLITEFMSKHSEDSVIIAAGYEESMIRDLLSMNEGLESRFAWRYIFEPYSSDEVCEIFRRQLNKQDWCLDDSVNYKFFDDNMELFSSFGRDTEKFIQKCQCVNLSRKFIDRYINDEFKMEEDEQKILGKKDLEIGINLHKQHYKKDSNSKMEVDILHNMYL